MCNILSYKIENKLDNILFNVLFRHTHAGQTIKNDKTHFRLLIPLGGDGEWGGEEHIGRCKLLGIF